MAEEIVRARIVFDTKGGVASDEAITELKKISGNLNKFVSGSMTGLINGLSALKGGIGTTIGGAVAVGASALSGNAINKSNIADWISTNQMNGSVGQGNFDIGQVQDLAEKGKIEELAKLLGTSKEKAQELADMFKVVDTNVSGIGANNGMNKFTQDLIDATKQSDALSESIDKTIEKLAKFMSMNNGGISSGSGLQGGSTPSSGGNPINVGSAPSFAPGTSISTLTAAIDRATASSNSSCSTSRTQAPIIGMLNTNSTNVSRAK